jgi:hypothetical protein
MSHEQMRNLLLRDKVFLRTLYNSDNNLSAKRVLNGANDSQLNTLLKYLHFLANGEIKIKKSNFEIIESHKKLHLIKQQVESKKALRTILNKERPEKLQFLNKLSQIYNAILYSLFNEI